MMVLALNFILSWAFLTSAFAATNTPQCKCIDPSVMAKIKAANAAPTAVKRGSIPAFLEKSIGDKDNQINRTVLERARANYFRQASNKQTRNACYLAMDATRPHLIKEGTVGNRVYLICEGLDVFVPLSSSHGSGTKLSPFDPEDGSGMMMPGLKLDNGKKCVTNFGNVTASHLTTGGSYTSGEILNSYKGQLLNDKGVYEPHYRKFLKFYGEGATANARDRDLGLHPATLMGEGCYRFEPANPLAKENQGFVFYAKQVVSYHEGRTQGCIGMKEDAAEAVIGIGENNPMAVYIYPEAKDIKAIRDGKSAYWNAECLKEIGKPEFWAREIYDNAFIRAQEIADRKPAKPRKMCDMPSSTFTATTGR